MFVFFNADPDRRVCFYFLLLFLSFLNGRFRAQHTPKLILIKILYKLILCFIKNLACFTISSVLWRLNGVCTINAAFDAMQKLIIIIKTINYIML